MKPDRIFAIVFLLGFSTGLIFHTIDVNFISPVSLKHIYLDSRRTVSVINLLYMSNPEPWLKPLCIEVLRSYAHYIAWFFDCDPNYAKIFLREHIDFFFGMDGFDVNFRTFVYTLGLSSDVSDYIIHNKLYLLDY